MLDAQTDIPQLIQTWHRKNKKQHGFPNPGHVSGCLKGGPTEKKPAMTSHPPSSASVSRETLRFRGGLRRNPVEAPTPRYRSKHTPGSVRITNRPACCVILSTEAPQSQLDWNLPTQQLGQESHTQSSVHSQISPHPHLPVRTGHRPFPSPHCGYHCLHPPA